MDPLPDDFGSIVVLIVSIAVVIAGVVWGTVAAILAGRRGRLNVEDESDG